jgi:hypothetical protein
MAKWQRRHYETIAAGLKAKGAARSEIDEWARKFAADNPRFRADYFIAASTGGQVSLTTRKGRTIEREYRNRSRPRRAFKTPSLSGVREEGGGWLAKALRKNSFAHGYRYSVICGSMLGKATKKKSSALRHAAMVKRKWGIKCSVRKLTRSGR